MGHFKEWSTTLDTGERSSGFCIGNAKRKVSELKRRIGLEQRHPPSSQLIQGKCWHRWAEVVVLCRPEVAYYGLLGHPCGGATRHPPSSCLSLGTDSSSFSEQEDEAPPRPPLPELYSPEDQPPAVPPLPKEATIIRHTSVRGLKRQSDERKRDREQGQCVNGDSRVSGERARVAPLRKGGKVAGHWAGTTASDSARRWSFGHTLVSPSWRLSVGTWPSPPWD